MPCILLSIISLIVHGGPKFGIDFVGGSLIQVKFSQPTPIDKIKDGLRAVNIENATVQNMGAATDNEYLIRIDAADINAQEFYPGAEEGPGIRRGGGCGHPPRGDGRTPGRPGLAGEGAARDFLLADFSRHLHFRPF